MDNIVGEKIRQIRAIKGLSQDNVAEEIGMSNGNFGKIERGEIDVNSTHLIKIAKVLKVPVSAFFEERQNTIMTESRPDYGFASKEDLQVLTQTVRMLAEKIERLNADLYKKKAAPKKKYNKT